MATIQEIKEKTAELKPLGGCLKLRPSVILVTRDDKRAPVHATVIDEERGRVFIEELNHWMNPVFFEVSQEQ